MIKDKALRTRYRTMACAACGATPCDPCHIKSFGSGGPDEPWNLIPLCRGHHGMQHNKGWKFMIERYKGIEIRLIGQGWDIGGPRLWNPNLSLRSQRHSDREP